MLVIGDVCANLSDLGPAEKGKISDQNELKDRLHRPEGKESVRWMKENELSVFIYHPVSFQTRMTLFQRSNTTKNNISENIWPVQFVEQWFVVLCWKPYVIFNQSSTDPDININL